MTTFHGYRSCSLIGAPSIVLGVALMLSLMLLLVGRPAGANDKAITGKKLLLKTKPKMLLFSRDALVVPGAKGSSSDPRCLAAGGSGSGATVKLYDNVSSGTLSMPCEYWSTDASGTQYKYKNTFAVQDGWPTSGKIKAGLLKVINPNGNAGHYVPNGAATVNVEVTVGADKYCMSFSGTGDDGTFFVKDAPAGTCGGGGAACGNNVREDAEVCDGTDAAACPGLCRADCTCGSSTGTEVCCEYGAPFGCHSQPSAAECRGTPVGEGAVCDNSGHCVPPPGTPGGCCQFPINSDYELGCNMGGGTGPYGAMTQADCDLVFEGAFFGYATCAPSGQCLSELACGDSEFPTCGGSCPTGTSCQAVDTTPTCSAELTGYCSCRPHPPAMLCNGQDITCDRRYGDVTFGATHNSFSRFYQFAVPNQLRTIPAQLAAGVRGFMLDLYYAYDELRLCHGECDSLSGYITFTDTLSDLKNFLAANPNEIVTLIFESDVPASQLNQALRGQVVRHNCSPSSCAYNANADLSPYLFTYNGVAWPTLRQMIEMNRRLVVMTSNIDSRDVGSNGGHLWYPCLHSEWAIGFETPYRYHALYQIGRGNPDYCQAEPGRGEGAIFILNNFITPPSYITADDINGYPKLLDSVRYCHDIRSDHRWPNFIAVDYENCDSQYTCDVAQGHDTVPDVVWVANEINASLR